MCNEQANTLDNVSSVLPGTLWETEELTSELLL